MNIPALDLSQIPAAPPPPGVIPNFIDPPSLANMPRISAYVTLPPMITLLALRMYARYFLTPKFGLDDYLCLLASATIIVYIILLFTILDDPTGPHMWDIPVSKLTEDYARISIILQLLFLVAAMFAKTAVLALYQRIFSPSWRSHILILSGMILIVGFYMPLLVVSAVGCIPKSEDYANGGWLSPKFAERCTKENSGVTAAVGVGGAVIDVCILLLPLFFVFRLHTSRRRKAGLAVIFIIGSAACVFSIVCAYYRFNISKKPAGDISWSSMPAYAWGTAEITVGISCSCIPVAFVLFKNMAEKSSTWASHFWYKFTDGYLKASDHKGTKERQINQPSGPHGIDRLPQVPQASMTRLRSLSFFNEFDRSNTGTQTDTNREDLNLTIMSREYDYHQHLRAGSTDGRT